MPRYTVPPCGYIRDVCYNDCAPAVKLPPPRKRKTEPPDAAVNQSAVYVDGSNNVANALLTSLLIAYYLS